jgi:hypothetical protein
MATEASMINLQGKINLRFCTLSDAIMKKSQERDFSYKTERKILILITEHLKFNKIKENYQRNGRNLPIAQGLYEQYVIESGVAISDAIIRRSLYEVLSHIVSRSYFCLEITKSISILTNPRFIVGGTRRLVILDLLSSLKNDVQIRIRRDVETVASHVFPVTSVPFGRLPEDEKNRFVSNMIAVINDSVKNNQATRLPQMIWQQAQGNNPERHLGYYRELITTFQHSLTRESPEPRQARRPINPPQPNPEHVRHPTCPPLPGQEQARRPASSPQHSQVTHSNQVDIRNLIQNASAPLLTSVQERRREEMFRKLGLLYEHMDKVSDLSPGETVGVYEYDGGYYTPEECKNENIPMEGERIVLRYMNEEEFRNSCNRLKTEFDAMNL